jgi:hypothetical protein
MKFACRSLWWFRVKGSTRHPREGMFERMRITNVCVWMFVRPIDELWNEFCWEDTYSGAFVMQRAPVFLGVRPGRDEPAPIARHGDADEIERAPARTVVVRVEGAVEGVVDV